MAKKEKINVLWISDLVVPTGFSRVSHSILSNLPQNKYNVIGLGVNYKGDPHNLPIKVFPAYLGGDVYGVSRLRSLFSNFKIDMVFILNDIWVIDGYLREIKDIFQEKQLPKIVVYFPVDALGHFSSWYEHLDIVEKAVTYTEFGKKVATEAHPYCDFEIIPHGVEKGMFFKAFPTRDLAKQTLFSKTGNKRLLEESPFIFLNANRNQPRKRLELTLEAFKLFSEGKDNAFLYMHCGNVDASHINVEALAAKLKIDSKLIMTGKVSGIQAVSESRLNLIYNACDAGINTGLGEGWGLPNMEHAATGAPQIVPDHSACRELYSDCGLLVPIDRKLMLDGGAMTLGGLVKPEDVAIEMAKIYSDRELYSNLSKASIDKFNSEKYLWTTIAKTWDNLFTEVMR